MKAKSISLGVAAVLVTFGAFSSIADTTVSAGRVEIVNCLFAGNAIGGEPSDFTLYANPTAASDGGSCEIVADHCLYEKPGTSTGRTSVSNVFQGSPRFVAGDARWTDEPYYALRHSSAARNRGINQDWMTSGKDRSGRARIVDSIVDIGCYECYVPPIGSLLLFR